MTREQREQLILVVLFTAIACVVGFYLVVQPKMDEISKSTDKIEKQKAQYDNSTNTIALLPSIVAATNVDEVTVVTEEKRFLNTEESEFAMIVNDSAAKAQMAPKIIKWNILDTPFGTSGKYAERSVKVGGAMTYHSLGKWLAEMEKMSPYIRVLGISVKRTDSYGTNGTEVTLGVLVKK